jgi:PAS domain S-box-containing protein
MTRRRFARRKPPSALETSVRHLGSFARRAEYNVGNFARDARAVGRHEADLEVRGPARRGTFARMAAPQRRAQRAMIVIIGVYMALTLALLPVARQPGPALPGFNAVFGAALLVTELATSFLLLVLFRQTHRLSVLVLANAYLYSALLAVAYVLSYAGAVVPDRPLIGTSQTISWIYNSWVTGYALFTLAAVVLEIRGRAAQLEPATARSAARISFAVTALGTVVLVAVEVSIGDSLPMLASSGGWTGLNASINFTAVAVFVASLLLILRVLRPTDGLFLWLTLAIAALGLGNLLSAAGGARYTVGWYACRLSWMASGCVLLLYFMSQFVRQHGLLARAAGDLVERTRERDRIWSVSEDLLGVSTFDGYFISINPAWTKVLGFSEDEIRATPVDALRHPDDTAHSTAARKRLAEGVPSVRLENRFRHKDGSWRWLAWTMTADHGLIYVAGRDITAEKEAQEALRKAEASAAQHQKIEALGQLTGGVAHDFNNLLMVVSGFLPRLKAAVGQDAKARQAVDSIEIAAQRGAALTRQLLSFARRQAVNPVVIDVGQRIETMAGILKSTVGPFVDLEVNVSPGLWSVKVDANELELALLNVVLNARDAIDARGAITIAAYNQQHRPEGANLPPDGEFVVITVSDTGCGIAPDLLPKVFDPFFTTKAPGKGTGLGLSQVHGFAHQSGGTAMIDSVAGRGTTVSLYLPRALDAPARPDDDKPAAAVSGTALLVEDNADVAEVSREMLIQLGYTVRHAANAERALALLDRQTFDLVLSDIVMPGKLDGVELARTIRQRQPRLPVVLVTGYAAQASTAPAEFLVLRKPYRFEELRRAIAQVTSR